jgi:hypothetical protein
MTDVPQPRPGVTKARHFSRGSKSLRAVMNPSPRDDEGQGFERLLGQLDNDQDRDFNGDVEFGRMGILSDVGGQRLGQSMLQATARGRQFDRIRICPYYMTDDSGQYDALLEFFATGQYRCVELCHDPAWNNAPPPPPPDTTGIATGRYRWSLLQWSTAQPGLLPPPPPPPPSPPGMLAAMEHIFTAMLANQQPPVVAEATLHIIGLSLTMPILHRALQYPRVYLFRCRMESPLQQLLVLPDNDTVDHDNSPERGSYLRIGYENDWSGILKAASMVRTNVTRLFLDFHDPIVGRLDLSSLIAFVATQPNGIDLTITVFFPCRIDAVVIVEHILVDITTQCPGVNSLWIQVLAPTTPPLMPEQFPRLLELVSASVLTRLEFFPTFFLNPTQKQQLDVILQRNRVIPALYLQTIQLLKPRRSPPPRVDDPIIDPPIVVVYADDDDDDDDDDDGEDRRRHQFVLSHALSQAAVHPIFFSHFYQYVRDHADQLRSGNQTTQHPVSVIKRETGWGLGRHSGTGRLLLVVCFFRLVVVAVVVVVVVVVVVYGHNGVRYDGSRSFY